METQITIMNDDELNAYIDYYAAFAKEVFYEFNGKINKYTIPDFYIDYNLNSENLGYIYCGRRVGVNIPVILNSAIHRESYSHSVNKDFYIKSIIIDTIIHELLHHNQKYDYFKYDKDEMYYNEVENAVINETYQFITQNLEYIQKRFNFIFDYTIDHYEYYDGKFIEFKNYCEYYTYILYWLCYNQIELDQLQEYISKANDIYITMNDQTVNIKHDKSYMVCHDLINIIKSLYLNTIHSFIVTRCTEYCYDEKNDNLKLLHFKFKIEPKMEYMITTEIKV